MTPAALTAHPGTNPGETNVISMRFSPAETGTSVSAPPKAPAVWTSEPLTVTAQPASCGTETMHQPSEADVTLPQIPLPENVSKLTWPPVSSSVTSWRAEGSRQ